MTGDNTCPVCGDGCAGCGTYCGIDSLLVIMLGTWSPRRGEMMIDLPALRIVKTQFRWDEHDELLRQRLGVPSFEDGGPRRAIKLAYQAARRALRRGAHIAKTIGLETSDAPN
jgi:hypothetical protein